MKKIFWFLITFLIAVLIILSILLIPKLTYRATCHDLKEATWEEGTVWFRPVREGGDCNVEDKQKLQVQFCYGNDRLEYKYCQDLGSMEYSPKNLLCTQQANFFFLFNDVCENTNFCEDSKNCVYDKEDNVCCARVRFKDAYFKLRSNKIIKSSKLSPYFSVS